MGYTPTVAGIFEEEPIFGEVASNEDPWEEPTFENPTYERPIYKSLFNNIIKFVSFYEDEVENIFNDIVAVVNCDNKILRHKFNITDGCIYRSIAEYLMKYFSHTFSTFCPNGKYHYSNDAKNYHFGVVTTDEISFGRRKKYKVRNITLQALSGQNYIDYFKYWLIFDAKEKANPS